MIIIEIKCSINVIHLNHPKTIPLHDRCPWKNCSPRNQSLAPRRLGTMRKIPLSIPSLPGGNQGTEWLNHLDKTCRSGKAEIQAQHPGSTQSTPTHMRTHTHTYARIHTHTHTLLYSVTRSFQFLGNSQKRNLLPPDWVSGVPTPHCPHCTPAKCKSASLATLLLLREAVGCPVVMAMVSGSYQQSRLLAAGLAHSYHA